MAHIRDIETFVLIYTEYHKTKEIVLLKKEHSEKDLNNEFKSIKFNTLEFVFGRGIGEFNLRIGFIPYSTLTKNKNSGIEKSETFQGIHPSDKTPEGIQLYRINRCIPEEEQGFVSEAYYKKIRTLFCCIPDVETLVSNPYFYVKAVDRYRAFDIAFLTNSVIPKLWDKVPPEDRRLWAKYPSLTATEKDRLIVRIPSVLYSSTPQTILYIITHLLQEDCNFGYIKYKTRCIPLYTEDGFSSILEWIFENKKLLTPSSYDKVVEYIKEEQEKYLQAHQTRGIVLYTKFNQLNPIMNIVY